MTEDEVVIAVSRQELGLLLDGSTILALAGKKLFNKTIEDDEMSVLRELVVKLQGLYWAES